MRNLSVTRAEGLKGGKGWTIGPPFQPVRPSAVTSSARFSSSLTRFGFALPPAAFITCPTRNPNVVALPPWYIATASAFFASTSAIKAGEMRLVVDLRQTLGGDDLLGGPPRCEHLLEDVLARSIR